MKRTLLNILIALGIVSLITIGGYLERGSFKLASEILAVPLLVLWILEERKQNKIKSPPKRTS